MKVIRIRIALLQPETLRLQKPLDHRLGRDEADSPPPNDDCHYWAEAIEDGDKFYYRVNDAILEISEDEFGKVITPPSLGSITTSPSSGGNRSETHFTLTLFDTDKTDVCYRAVPVSAVQDLDVETYCPQDGSPIYDAIGRTLSLARQEAPAFHFWI